MTGYLEMHDIPVMGYEVPESKLYSHEAEYGWAATCRVLCPSAS